MTIESMGDEGAVRVWADKGHIRRETLRIAALRCSGIRDGASDGIADLIIEGVTYSTEEMLAMGLKH